MYLNPEAYDELARKVNQRRIERETYINELIEIIKRQLAEHGYKGEVKGRPKHFYSIYQKMEKQDIL
jgi:GTP pyrophosphokinase